ncbi:hypothetical protein WICPIJ_002115, partial [Wickerhamomyces pijperi]
TDKIPIRKADGLYFIDQAFLIPAQKSRVYHLHSKLGHINVKDLATSLKHKTIVSSIEELDLNDLAKNQRKDAYCA